jgi:putative membrane protein
MRRRSHFSFMNTRLVFKLGLVLIGTLSGWRLTVAHPGLPIEPHDLWSEWNSNFFLLLSLEISAFLYLYGIQKVWRRAGVGRGLSLKRLIAFIGAVLALVVSLVSPLDALSGILFSAHMAQHLILILVVAPLLVISNFPLALLWALPSIWRRVVAHDWKRSSALHVTWRFLSSPLIAWLTFALAMWFWHMPGPYQAALSNETVHACEHLTFLVTAMLFWWVLFDTIRPAYTRYGLAVPYLFTTALHSGILGALLTFAAKPWYPFYETTVVPWGLSSLQDQQLAGIMMWLPGGTVFMLLSVLYFGAWIRAVEGHMRSKAHAGKTL